MIVAYTDHDGVIGMAHLVDVRARDLAGDPASARGQRTHRAEATPSPGGGAILPSRVIAVFSVTNGVLYRMYLANASFNLRASGS